MSGKKSESFCILPWVHTHVDTTGRRRICCHDSLHETTDFKELSLEDFYNSDYLKEVRLKMLAGEKVDACKLCDLKGLNHSPRDKYNADFITYIKEAIKNTGEDGSFLETPISYDYRFTNKCNFKCIMCNPESSHLIEKEYKDIDNFEFFGHINELVSESFSKTMEKELEQASSSNNLKLIYWTGGEPLVWQEHWNFLERVVNQDKIAKDIFIDYNTNLSVIEKGNKNLLDYLKEFKMYRLCLSLDGITEVGEYIRDGLSWTRWLNNYHYIKNNLTKNGLIALDVTISIPTLVHLQDFIDFIVKENIEINTQIVNPINETEILCPYALDRELLTDICQEQLEYIEQNYSNQHNLKPIKNILNEIINGDTFKELFPDSWESGRVKGKKKLELLEKHKNRDKNITDIYAKSDSVLKWWNNIPSN